MNASSPAISNGTSSRPRRRWLRFSIRTLLILVTLCGVWLGLKVNAARRQQQAVAEIQKLGGWVRYDFECDRQTGRRLPGAKSWVPKAILDRTGLDLFHDVVHLNMVYNDDVRRIDNQQLTDAVKHHLAAFPRLKELLLKESQATDDCLAKAAQLSHLQKIYCWDARTVTDSGTAHLKRLSRLAVIHLSGSEITDESLRVFGTMRQLEELSLQRNRFTDRGLAHLKDLKLLRSLAVDLGVTDITDAGLVHLEGCQRLERLLVQHTNVTAAGVARLQRAVPSLKTVNFPRRPGMSGGTAALPINIPVPRRPPVPPGVKQAP